MKNEHMNIIIFIEIWFLNKISYDGMTRLHKIRYIEWD